MKKQIATFTLVMAILLLVYFILHTDKIIYRSILSFIQNYSGWKAMLLISIVYILSNLFLLPLGLPINMLSGLLWGAFIGGVLINILATVVAALGFYIGRLLEQYYLEEYFKRSTALKRLTSTITRYDWQFVALARINPIVPYGLSNYLFGVVPGLSFRHYIVATVIANALPCFIFAALGSIMQSCLIDNTPIRTVILQVGGVLLLATALYVVKYLYPKQSDSANTA